LRGSTETEDREETEVVRQSPHNRDRQIAKQQVGTAKHSRAATRMAVSDARRARVYRTDPELFTGEAGDPKRPKITDAQCVEITRLRDEEKLSWARVAAAVGCSAFGAKNAYERWARLREANRLFEERNPGATA
jgi:hypothetical protein